MGTVKYTGPVASFHCPTNAEIRSLKVHFSPKQEGTGDPSPENVRPIVGWDGVEVEHTKNNLAQFEPYGTDGINLKWTVPKSILDTSSLIRYSIYIDNSNGTSEACIRVAFFDINGNRLQSRIRTSGTPVGQSKRDFFTIQPIPSGTDYIVFGIKGDNFSIKEPMIDIFQNNAFKATPYEPYRGKTTNYTFGVLGKNKFNWDVEQGHASPFTSDYTTARSYPLNTYIIGMSSSNYYRDNYTNWVLNPSVSNGTISFSSGNASGYGIGYPLKLMPNQTYFLSGETTNDGLAGAIYYDKDGALISTQGNRLNRTITIPDNAVTTMIVFYANATNTSYTFSNIQLELGSTATTYEPYDPNHTVYGGWVDLITGEVCEEYNHITLDSTSPFNNITTIDKNTNLLRIRLYLNYITDKTIKDISTPNLAYFNYLKSESVTTDSWNGYFTGGSINPRLTVYVQDSNITSIETFLNYLDVHPLEVCYELATPITYHLAPTQLQTFLGTNNVWSNADYVEVEYDLHETQDILARKQFIMASQPHIEEASGAIATFNTDMAAKLKECKVYFKPVQEGTGDPSPDNVRPITGWTGVEYRTGKNLLHDKHELPKAQISGDGSGGYQIKSANVYRVLSVEVPINTDLHIHKEIISGSDLALSTELAQIGIGVSRVGSMTNYYNRDFNTGNNPYVCLMIGNSVAVDDPETLWQLEIGSTATDYEPYSGTTLPIDWSDSGTIYGGYVDLVKGEVVAEQKIIDLGSFNWTQRYAGGAYIPGLFYSGVISDKGAGGISLVCDRYPYQYNSKIDQTADKTINDSYQTRLQCVNIRDSDYNEYNATEFRTAMSGVMCVYVLAEPIHYTIDPITLKTLRGINNVWSNTNDSITVKYWKH